MDYSIKVTPQLLREQANVYIEAKNMVEHAKGKVVTMNGQIEQQWQGKAFDAYLQQFYELSTHIESFMNLLASINLQLKNYADVQEARDYADRGAFGLNNGMV